PEGKRGRVGPPRRVAQVRRQAVSQRRHPGPESLIGLVEAEQSSDLPPERPEHAGGPGRRLARVVRGDAVNEPREVVATARRWQGPDVLDAKVPGDLVDAPRP